MTTTDVVHPDPCWQCTVGNLLTRRWLFGYRLAFLWARIVDRKTSA